MGKININLNDYMEHMSDAQQEIFKRDIREYVESRMQVIALKETIKKYGGIDTPFFKRYTGTPKVQSIMSKYAKIINKMQQQYPEFYRDFRREVMATSTKIDQDNATRTSDIQYLSREIKNINRKTAMPMEQENSKLINDIDNIKREGKIKRSKIESDNIPERLVMKLKVTKNVIYVDSENGDRINAPMKYKNSESKEKAIRKYIGDRIKDNKTVINKKYVNPSILKALSRVDRGNYSLPFHYLNIINGGGINGVSLEESKKKFNEKIRMTCAFDDSALFKFEEKRTARYAKKVGVIDELKGISEKNFWERMFDRNRKDIKTLEAGNSEVSTTKKTNSTTSHNLQKQVQDKKLADRIAAGQDAQRRIEEVLKQYDKETKTENKQQTDNQR